jgi:hypothetical protein
MPVNIEMVKGIFRLEGVMKRIATAACLIYGLMVGSAIASPINFDEAVDGDLSNSSSFPTVFVLDAAGTSTISFSQIFSTDTGGDGDSFRIDLASAIKITGMTLSLDATSLIGDASMARASYGMVSVSDPTNRFVDPEYDLATGALRSGSASFAGIITESIAFRGFSGAIATPVGATGGALFDMTLTVTSTRVAPDPDPDVAPIPLPASMWLLLGGTVALAGTARRKRHRA